jgi:hypothetical protein
MMVKISNAHRILVGNSLVKYLLGSLRKRVEDTIKMDLRETDYKDGRRIELAQDHVQWLALISVVLNIQFLLPWNWSVI